MCTDLRNVGLEIKNIRGQGYDGASNMASKHLGVQAIMQRESPLAFVANLVMDPELLIVLLNNCLCPLDQVCPV